MKYHFSLFLFTALLSSCFGQVGKLSGRILSKLGNKPTMESVWIQDSENQIFTQSDSLGYYSIDSLIMAKSYTFQFLAFGYPITEKTVQITQAHDSLNIILNPNCSYDSLKAHQDWQEGKARLLLIGSIAPRANSEADQNFEKSFNIEYYDFGCTPPALDCVIDYNKQIFKLLDSKYGDLWRSRVRADVIGLKH
ncbi:FEKKY domain-containing protein [Croceimicrobium hydrocarbonivorans]|uniref:Carboxypeptidase regulatory-like domain-containing protein n=1 Tax=Croceimicrobium hydrocarbonivorans TaxID=2761580 RepID=A0A7H0VFR0_9FLAO|nr:hypothetical protein [Croceimicrobium hydrocarbonivorans]QNR24558.1 hypothetical protein H4K34_01575 [Croceimicrobium hydrocarbonivorans]